MRGALGEISVPPTIRALVSSRLDRLDSDERQVLSAGAVLGETFTAAGAAAVADMSDDVARRLLDGLVTKAFLELEADADSDGRPATRSCRESSVGSRSLAPRAAS